jgi:transcriptional regulator with XRE-family HTH domain
MRCLIGELIEARGLKKGYIANQLDISRQQLSNWISSRSYPPILKAFQLADLLGVKVDDLYERN